MLPKASCLPTNSRRRSSCGTFTKMPMAPPMTPSGSPGRRRWPLEGSVGGSLVRKSDDGRGDGEEQQVAPLPTNQAKDRTAVTDEHVSLHSGPRAADRTVLDVLERACGTARPARTALIQRGLAGAPG